MLTAMGVNTHPEHNTLDQPEPAPAQRPTQRAFRTTEEAGAHPVPLSPPVC